MVNVQEIYESKFKKIVEKNKDIMFNVKDELLSVFDIYEKTKIKAKKDDTSKAVTLTLLAEREFPSIDRLCSILESRPDLSRDEADDCYEKFFDDLLGKMSPDEFSRDYDRTLGSWGKNNVGYNISIKGDGFAHGSCSIDLRLFNKYFMDKNTLEFSDDPELKTLEDKGRYISRSRPSPELNYYEKKDFYNKKQDQLCHLFKSEISSAVWKKAYDKSKELAKDDFTKLKEYLGHEPSADKIQEYYKKRLLKQDTRAIPIAEEIIGVRADYSNLQQDIYSKLVDCIENERTANTLKNIIEFTGVPAVFNEDKIQEIYKKNLGKVQKGTYSNGIWGPNRTQILYDGAWVIEKVRNLTGIKSRFNSNEISEAYNSIFHEDNIHPLEIGNGIVRTIKSLKDFTGQYPDKTITQRAYNCLLINNTKEVHNMERIVRVMPAFNQAIIEKAILYKLNNMPQSTCSSKKKSSKKYKPNLDDLFEIARITQVDLDIEKRENSLFRKPLSCAFIQTYKLGLPQERERLEQAFGMTDNIKESIIQEGLSYELLSGSNSLMRDYIGGPPDLSGISTVIEEEGIKPDRETIERFAKRSLERGYDDEIKAVQKLKEMTGQPIEVDEKLVNEYASCQLTRGNLDNIKIIEDITGNRIQYQ